MAVIGPVVVNKIGGQSRRYILAPGDSLDPEQIGGYAHVSAFICDQGGAPGDLYTSHDGATWKLFASVPTGTAVTRVEVGPIHFLKFACVTASSSLVVVCNHE